MFFIKIIFSGFIIIFFNSCGNNEEPNNLTSEGVEQNPHLQIKHTYKPRGKQEAETTTEKRPTSNEESPASNQEPASTEDSSVLAISYENQSIGNIDLSITKEEAAQTLTVEDKEDTTYGLLIRYEKDIDILWDAEGQALIIIAKNGYLVTDKTKLLFSHDNDEDTTGKLLIRSEIGFDTEDHKQLFLIKLYNSLEGTSIDCLQEKKCFVSRDEDNPLNFIFVLPKMNFYFSNKPGALVFSNIGLDQGNKTYNEFINLSKEPESPAAEESWASNEASSATAEVASVSVSSEE